MNTLWIIIGCVLLAPAVGMLIYGMIKDPDLLIAVLFVAGTVGGLAALIHGVSL